MKSVVEAYAAAHSAKDADAVAALFAESAVVADPVDQPEMVGREAVRQFFAGTHQGTDEFELSVTGAIRAVDRFAAVPLKAITKMGDTRLEIEIIDVFTFDDDGLISDMRAYWTPSDIRQID